VHLAVKSCADRNRDESAASKRHLDRFTAQPLVWRPTHVYIQTDGRTDGQKERVLCWDLCNSSSHLHSDTSKVWTQSGLPGGSTGDVGCVLCCAGRWYSQQHISCTSTTHTSVTTRSRACSGRPVASTLAMCSTVTYHQHATPPQDCHQSCSLDTASPARRTRHASISTDQTTSSASRLILSSCTLLVSDLPFSACCLFLWFGRMLVAACKYLCFLESAFPKAQTSVLFQFAFLLRAPGKVKEQLCKELVVR